jgi:rRNA-processing protein EBP2
MEQELNMESVSMNSDEEAQLNTKDVKNEKAIKNIPAMKKILDKMNADLNKPFKKRNKKLNWSERLIVVSNTDVQMQDNIDVNNDVQREVQFYNIALGNTRTGLEKVAEEGLKLDRPQDYLAEMFKSDRIMTKVRSSLVKAQVKVRNYEEQQLKKHAKKIQKSRRHEKNLEQSRKVRANKMAIDKWKGDIKRKGANLVADLDDYIKTETQRRIKKRNFQNGKGKGMNKRKNRLGKDARAKNRNRKMNRMNNKRR